MLLSPLSVIGIVSLEQKLSSWLECFYNSLEERFLHNPPLMVPRLWPGIRTQEVDAVDRVLRKKPLQGIECLQPENSDVFQALTVGPSADFAHTPHQPLYTNELPLRKLLRHLDQEASVAAPEI